MSVELSPELLFYPELLPERQSGVMVPNEINQRLESVDAVGWSAAADAVVAPGFGLKSLDGARRTADDHCRSVIWWTEDDETVWLEYVQHAQFAASREFNMASFSVANLADVTRALMNTEFAVWQNIWGRRVLTLTGSAFEGLRFEVGADTRRS